MTPTPQLSFNLLCIPFQTLELVAGHHFKWYRVPCLKGPYNGNLLGFMSLSDDRILLDKDILLCHQTVSVKHNNSFTDKLHVFTAHKLWCLTVNVHKLYDKILTPCGWIFCPSLLKTDTQYRWSTPVLNVLQPWKNLGGGGGGGGGWWW
jgi:hypothetical protein